MLEYRRRRGAGMPPPISGYTGAVVHKRQTHLLHLPLSSQPMMRRLHAYLRLLRLDRPIGIWLLLWPTGWALWLAAGGTPPLWLLSVFTLGVVVMRSAGCVINDWADRDFDRLVWRTRSRPLASGEVAPNEALALFAGLITVAALLLLVLPIAARWQAVIALALAVSYPFAKRWHHLPQVHLGLAFGWAIPMAFAAVQGSVPPLAWLLLVVNLIWTVAYDTLYAMADREDDRLAGIKSTALLFGEADLLILAVLYGLFVLGLALVGLRAELGWPWWLGVLAAGGLAAWSLWLARQREPQACLLAFRRNHWMGAAVFAGLVAALALR